MKVMPWLPLPLGCYHPDPSRVSFQRVATARVMCRGPLAWESLTHGMKVMPWLPLPLGCCHPDPSRVTFQHFNYRLQMNAARSLYQYHVARREQGEAEFTRRFGVGKKPCVLVQNAALECALHKELRVPLNANS